MQQIPQHSSTNARMKQDHRRDSTNALLLNKRQWLYVQTRYKLTPRERQIAELICQGLRNGKIANYLRIRPGNRQDSRKKHLPQGTGQEQNPQCC